jgi:hypothetical protein
VEGLRAARPFHHISTYRLCGVYAGRKLDDTDEVTLAVLEPGRPHIAGLGDAPLSLEARKIVCVKVDAGALKI